MTVEGIPCADPGRLDLDGAQGGAADLTPKAPGGSADPAHKAENPHKDTQKLSHSAVGSRPN
eukprot:scaffold442_cov268-Pinguiococcus_pyrenoidosus.AAC.48